MTDTIWKFPLINVGLNAIKVSPDAVPLCVLLQNNIPVLYMQTPRSLDNLVQRDVWIVGTGHSVADKWSEYVGTVMDEGGFVWHVYMGADPE